jgi:hypothetical protein
MRDDTRCLCYFLFQRDLNIFLFNPTTVTRYTKEIPIASFFLNFLLLLLLLLLSTFYASGKKTVQLKLTNLMDTRR